MPSLPSTPSDGARPVLFVAREPDETLRTFLPIVDRLRAEHAVPSRILFHHAPGEWARAELAARGVGTRDVDLPRRLFSSSGRGRLAGSPAVQTIDEIWELWLARRLARRVLERERPAAVVVIQDTPLLERFLVREANRRALPTVVVQWAFSFPQAFYDRLREIQRGPGRSAASAGVGDRQPTSVAPPVRRAARRVTTSVYRGALNGLGLQFTPANSYGGGEACLFAVMGPAFKEQFVAQGVRGKRIVVTGHPTHDGAYARAASLEPVERTRIRAHHGLPDDRPIVLYATQPVLWRRVITPAELWENVAAIARAVERAPGRPRLVLKLHPRERPDDYAFCAELDPPVTVIPRAEVTDLIASCDAFVSSSSSTVLVAMMLDRPIVTVNFNHVPHFDVFESLGGTLHTRSAAEFAPAIARALGDEPTRARLARERRGVLDRYTRFDGRATERLAALVAESIAGAERVAVPV